MLELLDPKHIDPIAYEQGLIQEIRNFSLLPERRIGWHYVLDYTWIAHRFAQVYKPGMKVIDIGCGPGAVHGYLESKFDLDIVGIDMQRWEKDYVDLVGDFAHESFRQQHGFGPASVDLIISSSAFEHNPPENHERLVDICMQCLRPGGYLLTTFAAAPAQTWFFKPTHQWNLSRNEIEAMYGLAFSEFDYAGVLSRWANHHEISAAFAARFKGRDLAGPPYLAVAAMKQRAA